MGLAGSRAGVFDKSTRETEFEKAAMQSARIPGPAEYTQVESSKNKGSSFGVKREPKTFMSPGPGSYSTINEDVRRP